MKENPNITRIDLDDPLSKAALEAEERLFAHYDLDYRVRFVEMEEPDLRLRVLEVGTGRPLLMVPGGAGDAWPLAALMAELKGWRMIAINRPGSGLSDGVDHRQVDLRQLAANTIRAVADAFELERVPIVCNSMGGLWSTWFTLEHPERVSRMAQLGCPALVLDTSAPFFMRLIGVPGINRVIAPLMQPNDVDSALDFLTTQGSSQEDIDRMPRVAAAAAYHFWQLPTYLDTWKTLIQSVLSITGVRAKYQLNADQLRRVQQPVQFVWGENDVFGDLDVARQVTQIMPKAKLHEMETGHLPFLDQPEETGRVIGEFLAQVTPVTEPQLAAIS
jgi:2-hydroxy-6-oxonona-2,4-dienedioate hydrolase